MATMAEIRANHQGEHAALSVAFYEKKRSEEGVTPQEQADFDAAHAAIWLDLEAQLPTASDYIAPVLPRDIKGELTEAQNKIVALETWKANLIEWLPNRLGGPPTE